ncbi:hypothetical protein [Janibacter anophelis]|uniref:hypothetical protein n=1 Tax=Janibacter anophelis TaxID=319054 RepID=UPI000DEF9EAD|nr:hypothetical protein [Janibacter anophelis]
MTSRRTSAAGLLAVAALALTACGGSDDGTTTTSTTTSSATSESTQSETSSDDATEPEETEPAETESEDTGSEGDDEGADAAPAGLSEPGTELSVGDTATIPQGDDGATIGLKVTEITKGSSADLSKLKDADKYKEYTPVYVQYEMSGTDSSSELGGDILDDVDPILADGRKASTLILIGTSPFEKCDSNSIPDDFGPGDTETTCQVAMVSSGQEVSGAQYSPYEGDYADDGAVVWKK